MRFVIDTVYLLACRVHRPIAPLTFFHSYYKPTLGCRPSVPFLTFVRQGYCLHKIREPNVPKIQRPKARKIDVLSSFHELMQSRGVRRPSVCLSVNFAQIATSTTEVAGSLPNLHTMVPRKARIQGVLKVKVKVEGHVIRALL